MNEKIKDLLPNPFAVDYEVKMHTGGLDLYTEEQMIEFAELIVKECLRRIEGCTAITTQQLKPYTEFEQGYDKAINKVYSQVKLHFGVK